MPGPRALIRSRVKYAEMYGVAGSYSGSRLRGVVVGNCQADPLSHLLNRSQSEFRFVKVPPVHLITPYEVEALNALLKRVDVVVLQTVADDYRGLPIGSRQLVERVRADVPIVRYPTLYYSGLHPYQCYVRDANGMNIGAPIVGYHDIRALIAARRFGRLEPALEWIRESGRPELTLGESVRSLSELRRREDGVDVKASDLIDTTKLDAFFTVNHPGNRVLRATAERIGRILGQRLNNHLPTVELLGDLRAPVEAHVATGLGLSPAPPYEWRVGRQRISGQAIMSKYLAWLFTRPDVVALGCERHAERAEQLGLML